MLLEAPGCKETEETLLFIEAFPPTVTFMVLVARRSSELLYRPTVTVAVPDFFAPIFSVQPDQLQDITELLIE